MRTQSSSLPPSAHSLYKSKLFLRPKIIVEVNRAMLKTAKTMLFAIACFGVIFAAFPLATRADGKPVAAIADGENLWITDPANHKVVKMRASDGTVLGSYTATSPLRLISDGKNIWTTSNSGLITKIQAADGAIVGSYPVGGPTAGIAFDG